MHEEEDECIDDSAIAPDYAGIWFSVQTMTLPCRRP